MPQFQIHNHGARLLDIFGTRIIPGASAFVDVTEAQVAQIEHLQIAGYAEVTALDEPAREAETKARKRASKAAKLAADDSPELRTGESVDAVADALAALG